MITCNYILMMMKGAQRSAGHTVDAQEIADDNPSDGDNASTRLVAQPVPSSLASRPSTHRDDCLLCTRLWPGPRSTLFSLEAALSLSSSLSL